jgi:outer membrane protein assembly factor BamD (BamD/ComL family)
MKYGNYPEARQYLLKLKNSYPRSRLYEQALVKIADTYFLEADYAKARELYQELERRPNFDYLALVYLRLAQIANREGKLEILQKYLDLIKNKFPNASEMKYVNILESYKEGFYVQLGAFSSKKNAFALQNELGEKYPVYIVEEGEPGYTLYKVRVGKYKNRKEAQSVCAKLIKEGFGGRVYP